MKNKFILPILIQIFLFEFVSAVTVTAISTPNLKKISAGSGIAAIFGLLIGLVNVFKIEKFTKFVSGTQGFIVFSIPGGLFAILSIPTIIRSPSISILFIFMMIIPGLYGFYLFYNNIKFGKIAACFIFGLHVGALISSLFSFDKIIVCFFLIFFAIFGLYLYKRYSKWTLVISFAFSGAQSVCQSIAVFASVEYMDGAFSSNAFSAEAGGILAGSIVLTIIGMFFQVKFDRYLQNNSDIENATEDDFSSELSKEDQK